MRGMGNASERGPTEQVNQVSVCIDMKAWRYRAWLIALLAALPAAAQQAHFAGDLDVPYVPTNQPTVEAMLRAAL